MFDCCPHSVELLKVALNDVIKEVHEKLRPADEWNVSRIDFTLNLSTQYVEECVMLAKRGRDPYRYSDQ